MADEYINDENDEDLQDDEEIINWMKNEACKRSCYFRFKSWWSQFTCKWNCASRFATL